MSKTDDTPQLLTDTDLDALASHLEQGLSETLEVNQDLPRPSPLQYQADITTPRGYHHGDLYEALLQASLKMIRRKGIQKLSLRAVAKAVGVSPAAPYRHFADKQELIAAVAARCFRQMSERLAQVPQGSPLKRLKALAKVYFKYCYTFPDLFSLMFGPVTAQSQKYPELQEAMEAVFLFFLKEICLAQEAGLFRAAPPEYMALTFLSQLHGFTSLVIHHQVKWQNLGKEKPQQVLADTLELLFQGFIQSE